MMMWLKWCALYGASVLVAYQWGWRIGARDTDHAQLQTKIQQSSQQWQQYRQRSQQFQQWGADYANAQQQRAIEHKKRQRQLMATPKAMDTTACRLDTERLQQLNALIEYTNTTVAPR